MKRKPAFIGIPVLSGLFFYVISLCGCYYYPTTETMINTLSFRNTTPGHHLKKKIGIALFENRTPYTNAAAVGIFTEYFIDNMRNRCPNLLFIAPEQTEMAKLIANPPRLESGRLNNGEMAQVGRALGLNAVIAVALTSISPSREQRGLPFFKETQFLLEVEAFVEMYDTETASILLKKSIRREIEVEQEEISLAEQSGAIANYLIEEALDDISGKMIGPICNTAEDQPWKGYVMAIDGERVMITSGLDVGLKRGERLYVYDSNRIIQGTGGHVYFLPGRRTGMLKITAVGENSSQAELVSGKVLEPGSLVMIGN